MSPGRVALAVSWVAVLAVPAAGQTSRGGEGWVVLPVEDYRALRSKAYPAEPDPESAPPPPVEAAVSRVDYDLRVQGEAATGEARLTVDVFRAGWVRVAVPAGLVVEEARLDGRPVPLLGPSPGQVGAPELLLSRPGRAVIALRVAVPVRTSAGAEGVSLPPVAAGVSRAAVVVPRPGLELTAPGSFLAERRDVDGETRVVAYGHPSSGIELSWSRKIEDRRSRLPLRLRGHVATFVGLSEDAVAVTAEVRAEVLQGVATSLAVSLPDGLVVSQVSGPLTGQWDSRPGQLEIAFLEPVEDAATFVVHGELRSPREGRVAVPLLRVPDAERETGGVAVEVLGSGEVRSHEARGLDPADPGELGPSLARRASPLVMAFRYQPRTGSAPRSLAVDVVRYTPETIVTTHVEEARYRVLLTEEGKSLVQAVYGIRNNQSSFLSLTLPATATLWSASVAGRSVRPGRSPEGALLLPLAKARAGEEPPAFAAEIVYIDRSAAWARRGEARLALPSLGVQVARNGVLIHHSPRYRVETRPGGFRLATDTAPASPALGPAAGVTDAAAPEAEAVDQEVRLLVERFQSEGRAGRPAGPVPVQVPFPSFGPGLFLASELAAEGVAPVIELRYRRVKR